MTLSINGTCGFYSGSLSNIVYSENFSGDGTFCTGYMAGGSFTNSGTLQVGDIFASANNNIVAHAPAGFGVFVNFTDTYAITQEYIVEPSATPSTATGSVKTFVQGSGTTDDGSGAGSCSEHASVTLAGMSAPSQFTIPITFGQPIPAVETVTMTCNDYIGAGLSFGDGGSQSASAGPLLVYDANGSLLGTASVLTVPEPSAAIPLLGLAVIAWSGRRRGAGCPQSSR